MAFVGSHLSLLEGWPEEHSIHLTVFLWWVGAGVSVDKSKRPSTVLRKGGDLVEGTAAALLDGVTLALLKVFGQVLGITSSHGTWGQDIRVWMGFGAPHKPEHCKSLKVLLSLCPKCHLLLSHLYLVNSPPQLCLHGPLLSSIMVLIIAGSLPAPSRLATPWDKHHVSSRSPEIFDECVNQSGDARKSMDNRHWWSAVWGCLQVSEPLSGIQEVKTLFIII